MASNPSSATVTRTKLTGDDARHLIEEQLASHSGGILTVLSQYEAGQTVRTWHATIRAVEEFINLPLFGIKDTSLEHWLLSIPIDERLMSNPAPTLMAVRQALMPHFEAGAVDRYVTTLLQTAAIANAFRMHGQATFGAGITLNSIGAAVEYYQSRRRHMVSLLYTMPFACKGFKKLAALDGLNVFLPVIEHSCIAVTSLHQKLALLETVKDYSLEVDSIGALGSHGFDTLDTAFFLEPERASLLAMYEFRRDQIALPELESVDPKKIFSAAELRNAAKTLGATYAAYGLNDAEFLALTQLVDALSRNARDDYFIHIPKPRFKDVLAGQSVIEPATLERLLVNQPSDYATNTNAYEPFVDLGAILVSNVNLLSRFLYSFKNIHLGSRRRFQIHAGFIFEDMVKHDLAGMGFTVTDIKRINRKEFDVVATYGGAIYNFQCKNNWIDLAKVESDRSLFLRYNRALTAYYSRALQKERNREHLLRTKLGLQTVHHYVISRFPVIGTDAHVINYNQIDRLRRVMKADA